MDAGWGLGPAGAGSLGRRKFLALLGTGLAACASPSAFIEVEQAASCPLPQPPLVSEDLTSLNTLARETNRLYGAAVNENLFRDPQFADVVATECGILVPEVALKWMTLRPTSTTYNFAPADAIQEFAVRHGMLFRGHTLFWHTGGGLPYWMNDILTPQNAQAHVTDHIRTVVGRYAGRMHSWDVVNEVVNPGDGRPDGLRDSPWLRLLGEDYIAKAFRLAAECDPASLLVYNEFGLDYATPPCEEKRQAVLRLLTRLKREEVPVHALGLQAHLRADGCVDPVVLLDFIHRVEDLGLKILITELDVDDMVLPEGVAGRDEMVAASYRGYLDTVLRSDGVLAILTWGLSDRYTYLPRESRPLPFDAELRHKPAWFAIKDSFDAQQSVASSS